MHYLRQIQTIVKCLFSVLFQGARLVITGHSLGAGTAALLAMLLKPKYPDLICYAFSPPGGLMRYQNFIVEIHKLVFDCGFLKKNQY